MKKTRVIFLVSVILAAFVASVSALELEVERELNNNVIVVGIGQPASYTFTVTNKEAITDTFRIYSLVEPDFIPKDPFVLRPNETTTFDVIFTPRESVQEQIREF